MLDISLLFLWFINLRSHHWGGHHLAVVNHRFPQSYSHLMPIEAQHVPRDHKMWRFRWSNARICINGDIKVTRAQAYGRG